MEKAPNSLMKATAHRLQHLLEKGLEYIQNTDEEILRRKISPEKWSKKEILGHLIDSGINNLQRFTEIQYEAKPYQIRRYKQDELVRANSYQQADMDKLGDLWKSVNLRIQDVMLLQTDRTLAYSIDLGNGDLVDLAFLIRDYVDHLEHHLHQIFDPLYPTDPRLAIPKLLA